MTIALTVKPEASGVRAAGLARLAAQSERLARQRFDADQAAGGAPESMTAEAFLERLFRS